MISWETTERKLGFQVSAMDWVNLYEKKEENIKKEGLIETQSMSGEEKKKRESTDREEERVFFMSLLGCCWLLACGESVPTLPLSVSTLFIAVVSSDYHLGDNIPPQLHTVIPVITQFMPLIIIILEIQHKSNCLIFVY